jgi:23S rRNA (adenine2503-C2)-methyltransferase
MQTGGMTHLLPLLGLALSELQTIIRHFGMPEYTAKQIVSWLYVKQVTCIDEMTDLSLNHRALLKEKYEVGKSSPAEYVCSSDGTIKYLYETADSFFVESVYIPDSERATLCVSSQVGCRMNCKFCMTGRQGFSANLSANEILNQIHSLPERNKLTNIVLMGMGEPLDNLDEVLKALEILTSSYGYGWSPRRITLSTVGLRNELKRFIEESDCHLAISLHSPLPMQRACFIPAERMYSITEIIELLREYDFKGQRRLSFEYILFKGLNDSLVYAKELVKLLRGLDCRVNLIRFHSTPAIIGFEGTNSETMLNFRDYLTSHGVFSMIRTSRGEDVFAACGMLSTANRERSKG